MKLSVYTLKDHKILLFTSPRYFHTDGEAIRSFSEGCKDEKSNLFKHPEDFTMYRIGIFDDVSGEIVSEKTPVRIADATQFKKPQQGE